MSGEGRRGGDGRGDRRGGEVIRGRRGEKIREERKVGRGGKWRGEEGKRGSSRATP